MFLHSVPNDTIPTGDPYALLLVVLIAIVFTVWVMVNNKKKAKSAVQEAVADAPAAPDAPTAPGSAGQVKLHNVEPKTAAMLMAIVADKMGKPLNELRFVSIKEVE